MCIIIRDGEMQFNKPNASNANALVSRDPSLSRETPVPPSVCLSAIFRNLWMIRWPLNMIRCPDTSIQSMCARVPVDEQVAARLERLATFDHFKSI